MTTKLSEQPFLEIEALKKALFVLYTWEVFFNNLQPIPVVSTQISTVLQWGPGQLTF